MSFWDKPRQSALRKALFQIHLWSGLIAGLYVVLIGITGSILVYRYEIEHAINPALNRITRGQGRASVQKVYDDLRAKYPRLTFQQLAIPPEPDRSWFWRARDAANHRVYVYFNQYTGAHIGAEVHQDLWMQWIYDLHAYLLLEKPGLIFNGIGGTAVTLLSLTGLIIWWPGIRNWRFGFTYSPANGWKRQNYDLHKVVGFGSFAVMLVVALTGIYYCFPNESRALIGKISGHPMTVDPIMTGIPAPNSKASLDIVLEEAEKALPGGRVWALSIPQKPDVPYTYRKILPGDWHRAGDHWVFLSPETGKPLRWERTADFPWGTRFVKSMAPLHFGTWGGTFSRILYIFLGAGLSLLAVTGYLMYWNRFLSKKLN
jgi:uncharacterized iron-regulated membrane protein